MRAAACLGTRVRDGAQSNAAVHIAKVLIYGVKLPRGRICQNSLVPIPEIAVPQDARGDEAIRQNAADSRAAARPPIPAPTEVSMRWADGGQGARDRLR